MHKYRVDETDASLHKIDAAVSIICNEKWPISVKFIGREISFQMNSLLRPLDQLQKRADRNAGRALCLMRFRGVGPGRSGYVEVRPFRLVDKLLYKDGTHYSAGFTTRADILDVGYIGFDLFTVFLAYR